MFQKLQINMNKNTLTVGIPFHIKSNPKYFELAIKSVIDQTISPNEVHLIQDGNINDSLLEVINKYKNEHPELIKLLVLPKKGLPYALNQSIKRTKTEFYARMDSDDISIKNRFEIQIEFFKKNKNLEILGTWAYEFENDYSNNSKLYINKTPIKKKEIENYVHYRNPLVHPSIMFRMSVFDKIGYYNEKMYTDQDLEFWGRALKSKINISNIQTPLIFLRIENRLIRRSQISAIKRQILIRYSYNTSSFKLNVLKLVSIILRVLPIKIRDWCYRNLRRF